MLFTLNKNNYLVNGVSKTMDVSPVSINGRTMLPMRFVTEKLGCEVEWIPETSQIEVKYHGTWLDPQPEPPMK